MADGISVRKVDPDHWIILSRRIRNKQQGVSPLELLNMLSSVGEDRPVHGGAKGWWCMHQTDSDIFPGKQKVD